MITLEKQIQIITISIIFGIGFMFIWSIFNVLFYKAKKTFVRLVFEIVLFGVFSSLYFIIVSINTDGIVTIYAPLFLFVGCVIYQKLYAKLFNRKISKTADKIYTKIVLKYIKNRKQKKAKKHKRKESLRDGVLEWEIPNQNETNLK